MTYVFVWESRIMIPRAKTCMFCYFITGIFESESTVIGEEIKSGCYVNQLVQGTQISLHIF